MLRLIFCLLLVSSVSAETWELTNIDWPDPSDSVWLQHYSDGTLEFTVKDTSNRQSWDTTITATAGRVNYAVYTIWYTGQTHPSTWVIPYDLKVGSSGNFTWYLHGARFPSDVDSSILYTFRDTTATDTVTATTDETTWMSYPITAYMGSVNRADIQIWYTGASYPTTWKWVLDKSDTTGGFPVPTDAEMCIVWGDVSRIGSTDVAYAKVIFSLAQKVNDTCTNKVLVGFTTETRVDRNGRFEKELIKSSCLGGAEYNVKILYKDGSSVNHSFTVPDSTSYQLIW